MKVTHYRNGDAIPNITYNSEWGSLSIGAYGIYPFTWESSCGADCSEIYGNLYNWYTVDDERGVCPDGWHVPSQGEYWVLSDYLGGIYEAGGKLKECTEGSCPDSDYWTSPNTGATNESAFTGLPGGFRSWDNGNYGGLLLYSGYWSSSDYSINLAWRIKIEYEHPYFEFQEAQKQYGCSIRCLADEITTGCTDPSACNYDETANVDDGSCIYPDENYDCYGNCIDASMCGEITLSFVNVTSSSADLVYSNSNFEIGGFQFDVDGVTVTGVSSVFELTSTGNNTVIAFSPSGTTSLPTGNGDLVSLTFEETADVSYMYLPPWVLTISTEEGVAFQTVSGPAGDDIIAANVPGCDNADCAGECGGFAVVNECGICGGDGSSCPGDIIITEFFFNKSEGNLPEYIELFNSKSEDINLENWIIKVMNESGILYSHSISSDNSNEIIIPSHEYFILLSSNGDFQDDLGQDYCSSYNYGFPFNECTDSLNVIYWNLSTFSGLYNPSGEIIILDSSNNLIDEVIYNTTTEFPVGNDIKGHSAEFIINPVLDSAYIFNDIGSNWQSSQHASNWLFNGTNHEYGTPLEGYDEEAFIDECGIPYGNNEAMDDCDVCFGNGWDYCDGDGDGIPNIEDWGYGAHSIIVTDVPNDQGGRVYLNFHKSYYDTDTLRSTESYQIERLDEQWVGVATQNAYGSSTYMVETATLVNSDTTEFRVIANMDEGNFVCFENGFGESIDNIFPAVPTGLMASTSDSSAILNWDSPVDADFQYFTVFCNGEILDYTIESTYTDYAYGALEYYITAIDANGNESGQSEAVMIELEALTGDVNDDYEVNIQDILVMINMILPNDTEPTDAADLNQDGIVNILDVLILINIILNP